MDLPHRPPASDLADVLCDAYVTLACALGAQVDLDPRPDLRAALELAQAFLAAYLAEPSCPGASAELRVAA